MIAARVTPQGSVLDPAGILIQSSGTDMDYRDRIDVAFDGTHTTIVWGEKVADEGGLNYLPVHPAGNTCSCEIHGIGRRLPAPVARRRSSSRWGACSFSAEDPATAVRAAMDEGSSIG